MLVRSGARVTFLEWANKWRIPQEAFAELVALSVVPPTTDEMSGDNKSEAYVQSRVLLEGGDRGVYLWRNNVGAGSLYPLNDLCEACQLAVGPKVRMIRWGLANQSKRINSEIKSGDLIGGKPTLITADMVGSTVLKFYSRECKSEGWEWRGTEREVAQLAWTTLINSLGGDAAIVNSVGSL